MWTGRLALQLESEPPQSFAAGFELQGTAETGQLSLFSPFGNTLAVMRWSAQAATLQTNGAAQQFDSLDALVTQVTGTALPIPALFAWLTGTPTPVPGWDADLSRLNQGQLLARRSEPAPVAVLRLAIDR